MTKVNKRLFTALNCKTLEEYISRLETSYEATRLFLSQGHKRMEECNRQLEKQKFINVN